MDALEIEIFKALCFLIANMLRGDGKDLSFSINGHVYLRLYILTDGVYSQWSCFIHPIYEAKGGEEATLCQDAKRRPKGC